MLSYMYIGSIGQSIIILRKESTLFELMCIKFEFSLSLSRSLSLSLNMIAEIFYMWRRSPHIPSDLMLSQRGWRNSWTPRPPPNRSVAPCRAVLRSWVATRGSATTSRPTTPPTRTLSVAAVTGASKGQSGDPPPHNTQHTQPNHTRGGVSRESAASVCLLNNRKWRQSSCSVGELLQEFTQAGMR